MKKPKPRLMGNLTDAEALPANWQQQPPPPPPPDPTIPPAPGRWRGNLDLMATVLGNRVRWVVLRELAVHGRLPVAWLASRASVSPAIMSQQVRILREAGVVVPSLGRLYELHPSLVPAPGAHYLDLGYAQLRLPPRPLSQSE